MLFEIPRSACPSKHGGSSGVTDVRSWRPLVQLVLMRLWIVAMSLGWGSEARADVTMCRWWGRAIQRITGVDAPEKELCKRLSGDRIGSINAVWRSLRSNVQEGSQWWARAIQRVFGVDAAQKEPVSSSWVVESAVAKLCRAVCVARRETRWESTGEIAILQEFSK